MHTDIQQLLRQLTLAEKISLLAGATNWTTVPLPRLGIPAIKVTDGPIGARGSGSFSSGRTSACFPAPIALAATWNTELVEQVGRALGDETRTKGAHVLLAPTVNIQRTPLGGRNFECYSEDPYLSARMAVAYIRGVQSRGVGACVKHYVCNDSEFERHSIDSKVRERTLREIYLPPFRAAVQEAGTWCVMASYNKVNGTYASENPYTLTEILRKEWGFDGLVMSDWVGTNSTAAAVNAGLDLEMPGPAQWRGAKLLKAVQEGEVDEGTIDARAHRVLELIARSGAFDHPEDVPEQAIDRPEHHALARRAAAEAIVLLKNEGNILPLSADRIKSLAVIGPNAKTARSMGGGSAQVNPHYTVTPYEGIMASLRAAEGRSHLTVGYEFGCTNHKLLPVLSSITFTVDYFNNPDLAGAPAYTDSVTGLDQFWFGQPVPGVDLASFSARLIGTITPSETGTYTFSLVSAGLSRLYVDGIEVIDNWTRQTPGEAFFGMGTVEERCQVEMVAGRPYELAVEYSKGNTTAVAGLRLGCLPPIPADAIARAAALAASSDVALVFAGLNGEWESEGYDRAYMELVGEQVALIEAVAAANPNTIVVLQTGSPVSMPWLEKVVAVVEAWYGGQECGNAIADVLFGDVNPSGRLPQTFPARLEDTPAYINYPGENGAVHYGEGIFVGYRYYDKKKVEPLFPFGHGLSYTSFAYENLRLSAAEFGPDDEILVSVNVRNTGPRAGQEVVQLYVRDVASRVMRPEKELKAFAKVALEPGEAKTITLPLDRASLAFYDDLANQWVAEAGEFEVLAGSSSRDIRATARFRLTETSR